MYRITLKGKGTKTVTTTHSKDFVTPAEIQSIYSACGEYLPPSLIDTVEIIDIKEL